MLAVPVLFAVSIEILTVGLLVWLIAGLMLGAFLLAVPSWLRYNLALYHSRPLPDRTVAAFEEVDKHIRQLHDVMAADRRTVDEVRDRLLVLEECRRGETRNVDAAAADTGELEEALVELKLELDALTLHWATLDGGDNEPGGKPLPENLLQKAMNSQPAGAQPRLLRHPSSGLEG